MEKILIDVLKTMLAEDSKRIDKLVEKVALVRGSQKLMWVVLGVLFTAMIPPYIKTFIIGR